MLNVNMDKHPHRINERRMASLKAEGGQNKGRKGAFASPHLTHEHLVELPMTPAVPPNASSQPSLVTLIDCDNKAVTLCLCP